MGDDKAIRVWNAVDGGPTLQPLEGHASFVLSVSHNHDHGLLQRVMIIQLKYGVGFMVDRHSIPLKDTATVSGPYSSITMGRGLLRGLVIIQLKY